MTMSLAAGLLLGALAAPTPGEHRIRIEHSSGPVEVEYRPTVSITHRQAGSVVGPGKASTLDCRWRANITVDRIARQADGTLMRRSITRDGVIEGRRAGWCNAHRQSIEREVAQQSERLRGQLLEVAQDDHEALRGELDRHHAKSAG